MELVNGEKMETDVQKVVENLLEQNKQLRLEAAVLKVQLDDLREIQEKMNQSRSSNFTPEVMEMLSKLDIK